MFHCNTNTYTYMYLPPVRKWIELWFTSNCTSNWQNSSCSRASKTPSNSVVWWPGSTFSNSRLSTARAVCVDSCSILAWCHAFVLALPPAGSMKIGSSTRLGSRERGRVQSQKGMPVFISGGKGTLADSD